MLSYGEITSRMLADRFAQSGQPDIEAEIQAGYDELNEWAEWANGLPKLESRRAWKSAKEMWQKKEAAWAALWDNLNPYPATHSEQDFQSWVKEQYKNHIGHHLKTLVSLKQARRIVENVLALNDLPKTDRQKVRFGWLLPSKTWGRYEEATMQILFKPFCNIPFSLCPQTRVDTAIHQSVHKTLLEMPVKGVLSVASTSIAVHGPEFCTLLAALYHRHGIPRGDLLNTASKHNIVLLHDRFDEYCRINDKHAKPADC